MITIIEKPSEKLPCKTSLFFTLGFYNPQLFGMLIQTSVCNFDKTTKEFEFPISSLSFLVCSLTKYDEVKFNLHSRVGDKAILHQRRFFCKSLPASN